MAVLVSDEGTLDTILVCSECNKEFRFNYIESTQDAEDVQQTYESFVDECIDDIEKHHDCNDSENDFL